MSTDLSVVRLVVSGLILIALVLCAGLVVNVYLERPIPDAYWGLAGTVIGALGALLVSTRSSGPATEERPAPALGEGSDRVVVP